MYTSVAKSISRSEAVVRSPTQANTGGDSVMTNPRACRNAAAEVRYTMESARLGAANKYDLI